jgi:site-specific recombinase XerD
MPKRTPSRRKFDADLANDLSIIWGELAAHMRRSGYPSFTIRLYQNSLVRVATWLSAHKDSLSAITGDDVPAILRDFFVRECGCRTLTRHRPALHCWLRFRGLRRLNSEATCCAVWLSWVEDYDRFLTSDNGLAVQTRIYRRRYARLFLRWRFSDGPVRWKQILPQDIWRFAERFAERVKPSSANIMLCSLRSFLRYTHLRGVCGPELANAVPYVANYGQSVRPHVLSEQQRRQLLRAFPKKHLGALRDRAMTLCLLDLGLRASDVAHLQLADFDRAQCTLNVFAPKTGERRQLPLTEELVNAIDNYIQKSRPVGVSEQLFLRIMPPTDVPVGSSVVRAAVRCAYARCGFPSSWTGTHRLRHTFATRLYASGADLVQIGSLLGHRNIQSSNRYTQVEVKSLRPLAQPWPR